MQKSEWVDDGAATSERTDGLFFSQRELDVPCVEVPEAKRDTVPLYTSEVRIETTTESQ